MEAPALRRRFLSQGRAEALQSTARNLRRQATASSATPSWPARSTAAASGLFWREERTGERPFSPTVYNPVRGSREQIAPLKMQKPWKIQGFTRLFLSEDRCPVELSYRRLRHILVL
jgi:hypothetical protein